MRRPPLLAAAGLAVGLALPAVAQAHVSLHPNTVPAGAFVTLNVRVPGEEQGAYAEKVDMLMPPGLTDVDVQNVPGWTVKEVTTKLTKPIQTDDGPVSQEISEIVWTGDRSTLGRLDNGTFMQFPLSIAMPDDIAGQSLAFKTLEYYSNGVIARWIGPPSAAYPSPTINVTAKGGVIEDVAGAEAGPTPGQAPTTATGAAATGTGQKSQSSSSGLAIVALILSILGLACGLAALAATRRQPDQRAERP
ncbi:MAG TPA: YcnI family protein [Solirubrobacteraceae bacterium]